MQCGRTGLSETDSLERASLGGIGAKNAELLARFFPDKFDQCDCPENLCAQDLSNFGWFPFVQGIGCPHKTLKKVYCVPSCFWVLWPTLFLSLVQ